jgi:hypothetical protein
VVRVPSVTSAERVECSPPLRPGEDGIEELTLNKKDTLLPVLWPLVPLLLSCSPEDT